MGIEFRDGFHNGDRVAADRAFGGVLFQDGGQLMERAAGVAPAPQVDEAFVIELVVDGVPVGLERSLVVPEELDRGFVAARANELVGDAAGGVKTRRKGRFKNRRGKRVILGLLGLLGEEGRRVGSVF